MSRDAGVDAHVLRLWRHRGTTLPTPRRGPQPQLDLDEILDAGIAIADTGGLAAVSTRAVAACFGKSAMALYPYVGTKENLLALMQDHACAQPKWDDPTSSLADALQAWASKLFDVYVAHPWLTERPWSQSSQGPNEQDWLERLLGILARWRVASRAATTTVTLLYATVRATAETDADYRRLDRRGIAAWREQRTATARHIPDLARRYPLSTGLEPLTPNWRDNPRAALASGVELVASAIRPTGSNSAKRRRSG
jgi:AcrR family transcriptional regulator